MPALIVTKGKDVGLFIKVGKKSTVLGRDPGASLQIDDEKVSRKHAQLHWEEIRQCYLVTDMTSINGTLVNGRTIAESAPIPIGGEIQLGDTVLMLTEEVPTDKANALDVVKRAAEKFRSTIMR